mgnify:CR=1 FL=1
MTPISHGLPEVNLQLGEVKDLNFLNNIEKGRQGFNSGISGSLKLTKKLHGIQKGRYYLIGAHPNVGKTQFTDYMFVFSLWLNCKQQNKPVRIFYCSLELSAIEKKVKWCCMYLNWKYGINWSTDFVMGRIPDTKPTDEQMVLIREAYTFVELMLKEVYILDNTVGPDTLFNYLIKEYYSKLGEVKYTQVSEEERAKGIKGAIIGYEPSVEPPLTLLIIDHMALLEGKNAKETMDEMSKKAVILRNQFGLTTVFVQQFNQDLVKSRRESLVRKGPKDAATIIAPQQLDFGDSTYTFRDADYVIGLVKPAKFELKEFEGFPSTPPECGGLGDSYMVSYLIKNRYGPINLLFPLFMNGVSGMFYDLPDDFDPDLEPWINLALKLTKNG